MNSRGYRILTPASATIIELPQGRASRVYSARAAELVNPKPVPLSGCPERTAVCHAFVRSDTDRD